MSQERTGVTALRGNPFTLLGPEIKVGQAAPDFTAVDTGLQPVRLSDFRGQTVIISAVPSLDTPVCDIETRRFNEEAAQVPNVTILTLSMDLPFAQKRWCGAAGVDKVKTLSDFRGGAFGEAYGVTIKDGPLGGVHARAVFVVDKEGKVSHVEYVKDISLEPNYEAVLGAAKKG